MMKKILHKKWAGFSLIEALIAALVVGLGLLGLAKLQGHVFQGSSVSRMQTRALNLAQEKIEELRADDYANLVNGDDTITSADTGANADIDRSWSISDCPNAVPCKQVVVTMTWTDNSGETQNVQLTSNISNQQPVNAGIALASSSESSSSSLSSSSDSSSSDSSDSSSSDSSSSDSSDSSSSNSSSSDSSDSSSSDSSSSDSSDSSSSDSSSSSSSNPPGGGCKSTCSGLVNAAIVTGDILSSTEKLKVGAEIKLEIDPPAVCVVLSVNLFNPKQGTYICNIDGIGNDITKLTVGGQEVDLNVNLKVSDLLPPSGLLGGLLGDVLDALGLPDQLVCVKTSIKIPITLTGVNATVQVPKPFPYSCPGYP